MWDRFAPCKHEGFQLSDALGTLGEYAGLDVKAYFNSYFFGPLRTGGSQDRATTTSTCYAEIKFSKFSYTLYPLPGLQQQRT